MPDIFHTLPINAPIAKVFEAISTPAGLNAWWTKTSSGEPVEGTEYILFFSEGYNWRAVVTKVLGNDFFELQIFDADADWLNTIISFTLIAFDKGTQLEFAHIGWPENNEHFRISSFCWAMYLRILKRWLEFGEQVAYEERLNV